MTNGAELLITLYYNFYISYVVEDVLYEFYKVRDKILYNLI